MKLYEVTGHLLNLHCGEVELSKLQAQRHSDDVSHIKDNIYNVINPIQIPKGEVVGSDKPIHPINAKLIQRQITEDEKTAVDIISEGVDSIDIVIPDGEVIISDPDGLIDGINSAIEKEDLSIMHWTKIKELVLDAGGEWVNKQQGIDYLESLND